MTVVSDRLARDIAAVSTATLCSRVLGFVRDVGIAALLGAGAASDAFFAALLIPNLFRRLLAEGALNAAFIPIWIRIRTDRGSTATRGFAEEILGTMLAGLGLAALACAMLAPAVIHLIAPGFNVTDQRFGLAVSYLRIVAPYVGIAGLVAVAAAALNAEGRVGAVSFGLVVYNVVVIAALGVVASGSTSADPGVVLSSAAVFAGLAQFLIIGAALLRLPSPPLRPRFIHTADARRFFAAALPGVIAAGIPQLKFIAGVMVASPSASAVSWLYYTYRIYELPLGVVSVVVASVMGPRIADALRTSKDLTVIQSRASAIAVGLALPAAIGMAVLAEPIASALFEHGAFGPRDAAAVAAALAAIAAGLPGHALEKVLGSIAFAHEDTRLPMFAALGGLVVAVAASLAFFPIFGHVGVAAGIAASGWVGTVVLSTVLARRRWLRIDNDLSKQVLHLILVAIAMGLTTFAARVVLHSTFGTASTAPARLVIVAVLVAFGLSVYLLGLKLFGVARMSDLFRAIRQRRS